LFSRANGVKTNFPDVYRPKDRTKLLFVLDVDKTLALFVQLPEDEEARETPIDDTAAPYVENTRLFPGPV
jgi:hypothetical protein